MLSICIPTYNNAETLKKSLNSITSQPEFAQGDQIEIVVSDNCSTDATSRVVASFATDYGERVKYFKNSNNVLDKNFEIALSYGSKSFLKLANDSLFWKPNSLKNLLDLIQGAAKEKPQIIFTNGNIKTPEFEILESLDDVIGKASFYITWIGSFSVWREDFECIKGFGNKFENQLTQVEALITLVHTKKLSMIDNRNFCSVIPRGPKSYNIGKVFGNNYFEILARPENRLSKQSISNEKLKVFQEHLLPLYFDDAHDFNRNEIHEELEIFSDIKNYNKTINQFETNYHLELKRRTTSDWARVWRVRNPNNQVTITNLFNFNNVHVGSHSYGPIRVLDWGTPGEGLVIGNYTSIANGVTFILGGNHRLSGITTFPVKVKLMNETIEAETKGPILIGDDVWIGTNATILSGITIGQGAVVAAESVVAKNVPPYAVVGGNPAKILKFRFSDSLISRMRAINYKTVLPDDLKFLGEKLYREEGTPEFDSCLEYLIEISKAANEN